MKDINFFNNPVIKRSSNTNLTTVSHETVNDSMHTLHFRAIDTTETLDKPKNNWIIVKRLHKYHLFFLKDLLSGESDNDKKNHVVCKLMEINDFKSIRFESIKNMEFIRVMHIHETEIKSPKLKYFGLEAQSQN
jgi:ribosomal 30S subunit maturation factor RimM